MKKYLNVLKLTKNYTVKNDLLIFKNKDKFKNQTVIPKKILVDEKFGYLLGSLGDRDGREHVVGLSNTNLNILNYFFLLLKEVLKQPITRINLAIQHREEITKSKNVHDLINLLKLPKENLHYELNKKQKGKLTFRLYVKNKPLYDVIFNPSIISKNPNKKFILSYLAARIDTEGNIDTLLNQVRIRSYNIDELKRDQKLLQQLGFKSKIIENSKKRFDGWHLIIGYGECEVTKKFISVIKLYLKHTEKLNLIEGIEMNKLTKREEEVYKIIKENNFMTAKQLVQKTNLSPTTIWFLLNNLKNKGYIANINGAVGGDYRREER